MHRINVVFPQPDDAAAGHPHREVVQCRPFAANHPQVVDVDRYLVTR
jgi:hypothetical protein